MSANIVAQDSVLNYVGGINRLDAMKNKTDIASSSK